MPPGLWQSALRRIAVALIAGASIFTLSAVAQPYPSKPIRIIVPSAPGGGTDISARLIAPKLSEYLGQQVVVENRAGASMMIGGEAVARAAPDGYTLLMGISTLTINPSIQKKMPYDAIRDFAPISLVVTLSNVLASHPALPIRNLKELIDFARTRLGQLTFGSAGVGSNPHLCMELFLHMSGLRAVHVPYKGSGLALVDLVAGQIALMMPAVLSGLPHIKAGRLRAYGVTSAQRASGAPDIPTIAEAGVPGYEALQWFGVLAPAGTPREIIAKLHAGVVRALHEADVRKRFLEDGSEPVGSSPEEFAALIRDDTAKWAKVIKDAGIKPE
jgi:tripartite-type tricarboxylate transporter receptor subunit TctC